MISEKQLPKVSMFTVEREGSWAFFYLHYELKGTIPFVALTHKQLAQLVTFLL